METSDTLLPTTATQHRRKWFKRGVVLMIVVALVLVLVPQMTTLYWVGRRELPVLVLVGDAESHQPVEGAEIAVASGPDWRGAVTVRAGGVSNPFVEDSSRTLVTTNSEGYAELKHAFEAFGHESWFSEQGYISTSSDWVWIRHPQYGTVAFPLEERSEPLRDYEDRTPVYVSVLISQRELPSPENPPP
jgi:hypothetical protein